MTHRQITGGTLFRISGSDNQITLSTLWNKKAAGLERSRLSLRQNTCDSSRHRAEQEVSQGKGHDAGPGTTERELLCADESLRCVCDASAIPRPSLKLIGQSQYCSDAAGSSSLSLLQGTLGGVVRGSDLSLRRGAGAGPATASKPRLHRGFTFAWPRPPGASPASLGSCDVRLLCDLLSFHP